MSLLHREGRVSVGFALLNLFRICRGICNSSFLYLSCRSSIYSDHKTNIPEAHLVARLQNIVARPSLADGFLEQHSVTCPLHQEFNQLLRKLL